MFLFISLLTTDHDHDDEHDCYYVSDRHYVGYISNDYYVYIL